MLNQFRVQEKLKLLRFLLILEFMGALVIKIDAKSNKLLSSLAKQLGGNVISIDDEQFEDLALGQLMDSKKTNETVSRDEVMNKLKNGR
jgi:hypothetical protein